MEAVDQQLTLLSPRRIQLRGVLDFSSCVDLVDALEPMLPDSGQVTIDLATVERSNSAGLALLIEWQKQAVVCNVSLSYSHVPDSLLQLARVCEADQIIALSPD